MNRFDGWNDELYHHGIKGQKWGLRKYQNPDGTLTEEGKARYGEGGTASGRQRARFLNKLDQQRAEYTVRANRYGKKEELIKKEKAEEGIEMTERTIHDVLNAATKSNQKINSLPNKRKVMLGKEIVKAIVGTAAMNGLLLSMGPVKIGNYAIQPYAAYLPTVKVSGTAYKAEKEKKNRS